MMPDRYDAILAAMPATRRDMQEELGLTKGALQNMLERLYNAGWCHVAGWERATINGTSKFLRILGAGPGQDAACDLEPLTQKERDARRYKKYLRRKQQLAAWAAPLTVKIAKRKPAKTFPAAVELENA